MIEQVASFLVSNGNYVPREEPLHVAEVEFSFGAVLEGPTWQPGLVLVVHAEAAVIASISRRLRAFRIVLERSQSVRPITLVVLGEGIERGQIGDLESMARVILLNGNADLAEALRPLLPLSLPVPLRSTESADQALASKLRNELSDPLVERLRRAARHNSQAVEEALLASIKHVISEMEHEDT